MFTHKKDTFIDFFNYETAEIDHDNLFLIHGLKEHKYKFENINDTLKFPNFIIFIEPNDKIKEIIDFSHIYDTLNFVNSSRSTLGYNFVVKQKNKNRVVERFALQYNHFIVKYLDKKILVDVFENVDMNFSLHNYFKYISCEKYFIDYALRNEIKY